MTRCSARVLRLLLVIAVSGPAAPPAPLPQRRDYLSEIEADKIRDALFTGARLKLFVLFAGDRLKKFQYENARPATDRRRAERLDSLLSGYLGAIEDAAELVELGRSKQEDIREGLKALLTKGKEYLAELERLATAAGQDASYKEPLADAIEATRDALADAEKAQKEFSPGPVRRKP